MPKAITRLKGCIEVACKEEMVVWKSLACRQYVFVEGGGSVYPALVRMAGLIHAYEVAGGAMGH